MSTQGTTGASGSVTSSATVTGPPDSPGPFVYSDLRSTCTATEGATTGSATIGGGLLYTKFDVDTQEPIEIVDLGASPAPNTEYFGTLDHVGDNFRIVFNEQSTNVDGSLTVNAAHMYMLGPIAIGEMILGQSVCGVTSSGAAPTPAPDVGPPADPPAGPDTTGASEAGVGGPASTQPTAASDTPFTPQAGVNPTTTTGASGGAVTTVTPRPAVLARTGSGGAIAASAAVILLVGAVVVIGPKWRTSRRLAKAGR